MRLFRFFKPLIDGSQAVMDHGVLVIELCRAPVSSKSLIPVSLSLLHNPELQMGGSQIRVGNGPD